MSFYNQEYRMSNPSADWTRKSCYSATCDWTANNTSSPSMKETINHYAEVANHVTQRELKRFIEEIKQKWNPPPPAEHEWEDGYRGEGWTEEAAFTMCVFDQATVPHRNIPERHGPLCEAGEKNQVLFKPFDHVIEELQPGPLRDPQPRDKIVGSLAWLKRVLQQRVDETSPFEEAITFELPRDFEELLHITDFIDGAGVPSETAYTYLVGGLDSIPHNVGTNEKFSKWFRWERSLESMNLKVLAAWKLGECEQHRQIYYVLCRELSDPAAPVVWIVFDRDDVEMKLYENLAEFLQHETVHIERRLGGHKQEHILCCESYPAL